MRKKYGQLQESFLRSLCLKSKLWQENANEEVDDGIEDGHDW